MNAHSSLKTSRAAPRPPADPERRHAILLAARDSFAERGFHRTTIRDIARQAGLAEGTLYNHFKNKDDLLIGLFEALGEQTRTGLNAGSGPSRGDILTAPLRALAQDHFALFRVVISEALVRPELGRRFMSLLGQQAAREPGEPEPQSLENAVQILVMGLALQRALWHEDPAADPDQITDEFSQLLRALGLDAS